MRRPPDPLIFPDRFRVTLSQDGETATETVRLTATATFVLAPAREDLAMSLVGLLKGEAARAAAALMRGSMRFPVELPYLPG